MLAECALVPDIFDSTRYSLPELCDIHLSNLKEYLLQETLVRDLRSGEWSAYVSEESGRHPRAKELIRKLIEQRRLRPSMPASKIAPTNSSEWCQEALASHDSDSLDGIISSDSTAREFRGKAKNIVTSIEKLSNAQWWQGRRERGCSQRLCRNTSEYLQHLQRILSHANSFMFIDPHLDPSQPRYGEFLTLLQAIQRPDVAPLIEIHRVCYVGSPRVREFPEWEERFRDNLDVPLKDVGLTIEVFIWDDFHDRYLITDIVGIGMQNGFDVTTNTKDLTAWFRLGRKDRDDIQREFYRDAKRHDLKQRFTLGLRKKV